MSRLLYRVWLEEIEVDEEGSIQEEYVTNIPHFDQIKKWLKKEVEDCTLEKWVEGELKGKIQSVSTRFGMNDENRSFMDFVITFVPGFRLSEKRRNLVWDYMDAQMSDGFGEGIDRSTIPGVPPEFLLYL